MKSWMHAYLKTSINNDCVHEWAYLSKLVETVMNKFGKNSSPEAHCPLKSGERHSSNHLAVKCITSWPPKTQNRPLLLSRKFLVSLPIGVVQLSVYQMSHSNTSGPLTLSHSWIAQSLWRSSGSAPGPMREFVYTLVRSVGGKASNSCDDPLISPDICLISPLRGEREFGFQRLIW